jgi:hypothetical protein
MTKSISASGLNYIPWGLSGLVALLAVYAWGSSINWDLGAVNTYILFPVLGLLAFSIMWSQYMVVALARYTHKDLGSGTYYRYTGYAVLLLIVLHPGLLIYQRFQDGFGLPPKSYETYVAPGMGWLTLLGTVSLLIFLAYELRRVFGEKSWWKYVVGAGDAAMIAIFYHGLKLGNQLQSGWYRMVWVFFGVTLIIAIVYKYASMLADRSAHD